jgi:hypothetical protein
MTDDTAAEIRRRTPGGFDGFRDCFAAVWLRPRTRRRRCIIDGRVEGVLMMGPLFDE